MAAESSPSSARFRRLNGDTTWLVQLPRAGGGVFTLLVDPWLAPSPQTDVHPLFSEQSRVKPSSHGSISALQDELGEVDGVLISHPFTDHLHAASLVLRSASGGGDGSGDGAPLKVFCPPKARAAVDGMVKHAGKGQWEAYTLPVLDFNFDGENEGAASWTTQDGLPHGIRVAFVPAREGLRYGPAWGDLHSGIAVLWAGHESRSDSDAAVPAAFSAAVYSPHGILQGSIPPRLAQAQHRVLLEAWDKQTLPLIRYLSGPVSLGYESVLSCYPASSGTATATATTNKKDGRRSSGEAAFFAPTVLLRTHDEDKTAKGLIAKIITRVAFPPGPAERRAGDPAGAMKELLRERGVGEPLPQVADLPVGGEVVL